MSESLRTLSDQQVLRNTDAIAAEDRKLTLRLLWHLHEIERRKLYLAGGYGSMFHYCTAHLRFSEPAALRRIRTARCVARFPQIAGMLESGEVNLTTVAMVTKYLKPENADSILSRIKGKSRRAVERVIAEFEPLAVLPPDRVRPVAIPVSIPIAPGGGAREFTVAGDGKKSSSVEVVTADASHALQPESSCALTAGVRLERRAVISFTSHEELIEKLDRIRSIASHRLPTNSTFEQLIDFMADYVLRREDPAARQERREGSARRAVAKPLVQSNPRQIPLRLRDQVFARDKHCTYTGSNGNRCGSTHLLQIDHIVPVARGGTSTLDNLRLLCAYHNRLESERLLGLCDARASARDSVLSQPPGP